MLKFNEPEPESYSSKRISEEETREVLRLWETEQEIEQEQHDKEAAMPTVHDVAETLSIPEEDVVRLLEKVRNDKLPDPPEPPAEPTIKIPAAPVKKQYVPPIIEEEEYCADEADNSAYINSRLAQRRSEADSYSTSYENPLEIQGVVEEENSDLAKFMIGLIGLLVIGSLFYSVSNIMSIPRFSNNSAQYFPGQIPFNNQGYVTINGQTFPISPNSGFSSSSSQYSSSSLNSSSSYANRNTTIKTNDLMLKRAILSQNKDKITKTLSTIVSTESGFASWSTEDQSSSGSGYSQPNSATSLTKAAGRRKFSAEGSTPLQYAQLHNRKGSFYILVQAGADINDIEIKKGKKPTIATTPLIDAVIQNSTDWCQFLLDNGALLYVPKLHTITIRSSSSDSENSIHPIQALELAAELGNAEICRILLENKDLENEDNILSFERARALAVKHRHQKVVEMFNQKEKELLSRNHPSE